MVSFWPWKGEDSSPASFEKALSQLSLKITKASTDLDSCRQRARRIKALWTLYSSFAYLLYVMIVAFAIGWHNWGATEYTALAGGPLCVYLVRLGLSAYYDFRTSSYQAHLDTLQKQRETTIDKLKTATKYNTTQELLEKYGGVPQRSKTGAATSRKTSSGGPGANTSKRTDPVFVPPTANIQGRNVSMSLPSTPQRLGPASMPQGLTQPFSASASATPWQQSNPQSSTSGEFAPNAFASAPQYAQIGDGSRWYDRFMDVLLGEDESSPKNRLALICKNCRLVNGQAPPGIKQLKDVGRWQCYGCGTMNGEESEEQKLVAQMKERVATASKAPVKVQSASPVLGNDGTDEEVVLVGLEQEDESDVTQYSEEDSVAVQDEDKQAKSKPDPEEEAIEPKRKRGRPKGSVKK